MPFNKDFSLFKQFFKQKTAPRQPATPIVQGAFVDTLPAADVDFSKVNYALMKALYYGCEVNKDGIVYGDDFLLGSQFARPIVNAATAFIIGTLPMVQCEGEGEEYREAERIVSKYLEQNRSLLIDLVRLTLRDGDCYVRIDADKLTLLSAEGMEMITDPLTGEPIKFYHTIKTQDQETGEQLNYREIFSLTDPHYVTQVARDSGQYEDFDSGLPAPTFDGTLPIVDFHNDREPDAVYGSSELLSSLTLFKAYHDVFKSGIENNIYNNSAMPVFKGITNFQQFLQMNKASRLPNGDYEVNLSNRKLILLGEGADVEFLQAQGKSAETEKVLQLLFWNICQTSETPEFVMGTAVSSSKASVSEQMPVMIRKADRKRNELTQGFNEIINRVYSTLAVKYGLPENVELSIKWRPILNDDLSVNQKTVEMLSSQGLITNQTKLEMLHLSDYVDDIQEEIEKAQQEVDEHQVKVDPYNESNSWDLTENIEADKISGNEAQSVSNDLQPAGK